MSHWTTLKAKIKDLNLLEQVADNMGIVFDRQVDTLKSHYAGTINCEGVLHNDGESLTGRNGAAVVAQDEAFTITMDNYGNSLVQTAGKDCGDLMHEYTKAVIQREMVNKNFTLMTSKKVANGDTVMVFNG